MILCLFLNASKMYRISRDLAFIADVFEGIADFQGPKSGPFLDLDSLIRTAPFDITWLIDYLNGERPIIGLSAEEIKQATDYIGLRINIDFNNLQYEEYLWLECPALFKNRMKDLILRWKWSRPNSGLAPFENTVGASEWDLSSTEFDIPRSSVLGRTSFCKKYESINNPDRILINNEIELTNSLPWYTNSRECGLILAGGAVLNALDFFRLPVKDYDLFIVARTKEEAIEVVRSAVITIISYYKNRNIPFMFVAHTGTTVTFNFPEHPDQLCNIQIILRAYESPAQVINGFDIDASCVGYTPERGIFMCTRAVRALRHGWNMIDPMCQSPSYEFRMKKYFTNYNLGVYIPFLKNVPSNLMYFTTYSDSIDIKELTGRTIYPEISRQVMNTFNKYSFNVYVYTNLVKVEGFYRLLILFTIPDYSTRAYETSGYCRYYVRLVKYLEVYSASRRINRWSKWITIIDKFLESEDVILFKDPQAQMSVFEATSQPKIRKNWYDSFNTIVSNVALINNEIQSLYYYTAFNKERYIKEVIKKINLLDFKFTNYEISCNRCNSKIQEIFRAFIGTRYYISVKMNSIYEKYQLSLTENENNVNNIEFLYEVGRWPEIRNIKLAYKCVDIANYKKPDFKMESESSGDESDESDESD